MASSTRVADRSAVKRHPTAPGTWPPSADVLFSYLFASMSLHEQVPNSDWKISSSRVTSTESDTESIRGCRAVEARLNVKFPNGYHCVTCMLECGRRHLPAGCGCGDHLEDLAQFSPTRCKTPCLSASDEISADQATGRYQPEFDVLRRKAEARVAMGGAFPDSSVSILRVQNAALSGAGKSSHVASVHGVSGFPFCGEINAPIIWPLRRPCAPRCSNSDGYAREVG